MPEFFNAFISYGRADSKTFATQLHNRLSESGLDIWFDQNDIPLGVDFQNQIDDGIEKADNFLFVIAPHSVNSPYCRKEINLALQRNKRIIPLLHVEEISYDIWQQRYPTSTLNDWKTYQERGLHSSFPNIHPEIGKINWVYFREGIDDFEPAFAGLLEILDRQKDYVHQHTYFLTRSLEWEQQKKSTRYLLIGEERQQAEIWLKTRFKDGQPPCLPTDLHCEFITESIKNANNLMTQVFLAHAEVDHDISEEVRKSLMRTGFTIWTNKRDIKTGVDFQTAIFQGLEEADNIVFLLSPASLQSEYCQKEINYAASLNKRIIPILIQAIDTAELPPVVQSLQYIDLTDNLNDTDYLQDESQLLRTLQQDITYYEEHKILLAKALKWKRQHQNPSMLLRGYNLRHAESWLKVAQQRSLHPPTVLQEEFITESLRQPPGISLEIFISYSRADSDFARRLNEALQIQGKTTWFDQESIASGTDFQKEIYRGIENANNFLFVISPNSIHSPYCSDEVEHAHKLNKRIVTLLYRPIDPAHLHPVLASVQWIDFNQHAGDFSANFNELVRTLDTDVEHLQTHTRLLVRAIEWENKGCKESLLLRGDELVDAENWLVQKADQEPLPAELHREYIHTSRSVEDAHDQAKQILQKAARKGKQRILIGTGVMGLGIAIAVGSGFFAQRSIQEVKEGTRLEREGGNALRLFESNQLHALVDAVKVGQALKKLVQNRPLDQYLVTSPLLALQSILDRIQEQNQFRGHQDSVTSASFSPNGKLIVTASYDQTARIWDLQGNLIAELKDHLGAVHSASFSPDGQKIVTASDDKAVRIWDLQGNIVKIFKGHQGAVHSASFSPDGKLIVTASDDNTARIWDLQGNLITELKGHQDSVLRASFSPDGQKIVTGSYDKTARIWDLQGNLITELKGHQGPVYSVSLSPDGQKIVTASYDKTARIWDLQGNPIANLQGHQEAVFRASFSPDGQRILTASVDKTAQIWDLKGNVITELKGHQGAIYAADFSPDGHQIVTASADKTIRIWNFQGHLVANLKGHQASVSRASFSPDGQKIVTASRDQTARIWDLQGTLIAELKGHQGAVNAANFSPDGQRIITASIDKTARIWDLQGNVIAELQGHQEAVNSASFSPDGQLIITASDDKTARIWDLQGNLIAERQGHQEAVSQANFSPDGQKIVTASVDQTARIWDLQGNVIADLNGHQGPVYGASFSPDGQKVVTASDDNTARIWDMQGNLLLELKGHQDTVSRASFSPDGKKIVTASADQTARVWDMKGNLIAELKGHQGAVNSASFSPDGKKIVTASADQTARVWRFEGLDQLLAHGCNWLADYLKQNPDFKKQHQDLCNLGDRK